jgi:hypothetical protein
MFAAREGSLSLSEVEVNVVAIHVVVVSQKRTKNPSTCVCSEGGVVIIRGGGGSGGGCGGRTLLENELTRESS